MAACPAEPPMHKHDSHQLFFRSPQGPLACGQKVRVRFLSDEAQNVILRTWDGEERQIHMEFDGKFVYTAILRAPETPMLWWYDFIIDGQDGRRLRYGNAYDQKGGEGAFYQGQPASFQITVYDPCYDTPEFMKRGIIYQIFPDRFRRAPSAARCGRKDITLHENWDELPLVNPDPRSGDNQATDFFGGTLTGIREKLPYLKELGVTVLYLNPVFKARSNHRYDTGDYHRIDPILGTKKEFEDLCREAEGMGVRILLDGVFSHTGEDSVYFNRYGRYPSLGAYQSPESPYASWYRFESFPEKYACWWGIPSLPEVVKSDPAYQEFMFQKDKGVVPRWLRSGASGWRLDVADELPMDFLKKLRQSAKAQKKDALVLGEVWEDASNKVSYGEARCYCLGDTLDSVMNYPLREALIAFLTGASPARELCRLLRHQQEVYPPPFLYALMNLMGSHDRARILNVLCGCEYSHLPREERAGLRLTPEQYELAVTRLKKGVALLCALPGAPTLYYGDEAGMQGTADPFCRGTYPWGREDQELLAYVRGQLNARRQSALLQTGFAAYSAPDEDTIRILRYAKNGRDAFGEKLQGVQIITIRR